MKLVLYCDSLSTISSRDNLMISLSGVSETVVQQIDADVVVRNIDHFEILKAIEETYGLEDIREFVSAKASV